MFNNSWNYFRKVVNSNNYTISYEQVGGFSNKKKAESAYEKDERKYESDITRIKRMTNMRYTFREFVEYWLSDIFLPNTDTVTKVYGTWAVNRLILLPYQSIKRQMYVVPVFQKRLRFIITILILLH